MENMRKIVSLLIIMTLVLASASVAFADSVYYVKKGDSLSKIGKKYGVSYTQIAKKNKIKDAKKIYVGQKLIIPTKSTTTTNTNKPVAKADPTKPVVGSTMIIATTTSTNDTGLLDVLVPAFDKKYGTKSKWISVGSGEAMEMGKRGDADVLLVHSRAAEDAFIKDGYGVNRKDVMYNYFYIVGPKNDPAKIKGMKTAKEGFSAIYNTKSNFLSRADKSGTNTKELSVWKAVGVSPNAASDKWYKETGLGMLDLLNMANEMGDAYTLVDSGTWGAFKDQTKMEIMIHGDSALFNPYGVIAVNPAKYPNVNNKAANAFINFITSTEGQKIIKDYKKNGQNLFVPNAK